MANNMHYPALTSFPDVEIVGLCDLNEEKLVATAEGGEEPVLAESVNSAADSGETYIIQGFYAENRDFIDAVKSNSQLHNSISDSVKTMELADMIYSHTIK